jgi:hypothetical protein
MLEEWALRYKKKTGKVFDVPNCHIRYVKQSHTIEINHLLLSRCLAHIINLATQDLIKTRSKARYYSPHEENQEYDGADNAERDELGLVRAICVKVRVVINLKPASDYFPKKN